jgi:hypothetical protein
MTQLRASVGRSGFAVPFTLFALALFAAAGGASCKGKPKAGDPCTQGEGVCADPKTMMACIKGAFASMPCQGADGCATKGSVSECDNSLSRVGDSCDEVGDFACAVDKKAALSCKDNKFVVEETCKGARACALQKDGLYCDNDLADQGDPCHTEGDYACTNDKKLALKCADTHVMVALNTCKGAKGCRVLELPEQKKVEFVCDDAVADANDACDENGEQACTVDRTTLLQCSNNKFLFLKACAGGCSFDPNGDKFACDQAGLAAAGASPSGPKKAAKRGK